MDTEHIQLAHGGGGQLTAELIEQVILPTLGAGSAEHAGAGLKDAATLAAIDGPIAFTTDTYVVKPLEFPGGDIGKLAICGTVNDLSVVGARPVALSLALVLEEGLPISLLRRMLASAGATAAAAGVAVVTGDTKVVERGALDGMIINTAGVGAVSAKARLGFGRIVEGDRIILSGALGEHGLAVMTRREGLNFSADLKSDCAPLYSLTRALVDELGDAVRFMRDPTRGGLAATLAEVSLATQRDLEIMETAIPVNGTARAAAEMLGLDLLSAANEGKLVAIVAADAAGRAVELLKADPIAARAADIGAVGRKGDHSMVELVTAVGGRRIVQMPYGEELPRIC